MNCYKIILVTKEYTKSREEIVRKRIWKTIGCVPLKEAKRELVHEQFKNISSDLRLASFQVELV